MPDPVLAEVPDAIDLRAEVQTSGVAGVQAELDLRADRPRAGEEADPRDGA